MDRHESEWTINYSKRQIREMRERGEINRIDVGKKGKYKPVLLGVPQARGAQGLATFRAREQKRKLMEQTEKEKKEDQQEEEN